MLKLSAVAAFLFESGSCPSTFRQLSFFLVCLISNSLEQFRKLRHLRRQLDPYKWAKRKRMMGYGNYIAPTSLCSALTDICPWPHQDTFVAMTPRNWWSHYIRTGASMYTAASRVSTRRTEVFEKNGPRNRIKTGFSAQECGKHGPEQPLGWLANDRTESIKEGTSKVIAVI